jgi:hypothetical protein
MAKYGICSYIEAGKIEYLKALDIQDRIIEEKNRE